MKGAVVLRESVVKLFAYPKQAFNRPRYQWLALLLPIRLIFLPPQVDISDLAGAEMLVLAHCGGMEGVEMLWECCRSAPMLLARFNGPMYQ